MTAVTEVEDTPSVQDNPTSNLTQSAPSTTTSTTTSVSSAPGKKSAESELIPYTPAKRSTGKSRAEMAYAVDALLGKTLQDMQETHLNLQLLKIITKTCCSVKALYLNSRRCQQDKTDLPK